MSKRHITQRGDLASLFIRLEELVLASSGEDAFEEIFKLLIAKLRDERSGKPERLRLHSSQRPLSASAIEHIVRELLAEAEAAWPGVLEPGTRPLLSTEHLAVCVRELSTHRVSDESLAVLDALFELLVSRSSKGHKGQFFTPRHVIELCVRIIRPRAHESVLDPACGSGGFLFHALSFVQRHTPLHASALSRYCSQNLWGFDIDRRAVRIAQALLLLASGETSRIARLNSLQKPVAAGEPQTMPGSGADPETIEQFSQNKSTKHFDIILTNPPFAGDIQEAPLLSQYAITSNRQKAERDVLFLERCVDLLNPGGRLAMILPHNKFSAEPFAEIRRWLIQRCRVIAVVALGRNTFLPHTHQKASVLFAEKREAQFGHHHKSPHYEKENIFFAISDRAGKDSKGKLTLKPGSDDSHFLWDRIDHDFDEILSAFDAHRQKSGIWSEV